MKPIYTGPIDEGICLICPFELKQVFSAFNFKHHYLVKPLPCRITLPSDLTSNHLGLNKLRLTIRLPIRAA